MPIRHLPERKSDYFNREFSIRLITRFETGRAPMGGVGSKAYRGVFGVILSRHQKGLWHDNVTCPKFTTKPRYANFSQPSATFHAVFTWVFFSCLLFWELVHDKICKFALPSGNMHKHFYKSHLAGER